MTIKKRSDYSVRNNNTFYGENAKPNYLIEFVSSGSKIVYQTNTESELST